MDFSANPDLVPKITYHLFERGKWVHTGSEMFSLAGKVLTDSMKVKMAVPVQQAAGEYQIIFTLLQGEDIYLGFHGKFLAARIP